MLVPQLKVWKMKIDDFDHIPSYVNAEDKCVLEEDGGLLQALSGNKSNYSCFSWWGLLS